MAIPTSKENGDRINKCVHDMEKQIAYLYHRWQDEKEYEDINDYGTAIKAKLPKGFKLIKMTKRPFGFHFSIGTDAVYAICRSSKEYEWKRIA